jgi:hypothetical protein
MKKKSFFIFSFLFIFLNLFSQKAVYQLPVTEQTRISNTTFFYTLPKTAFLLDVVVTKTAHYKGIYADFAEKMLGITNYCQENSATFQLKNIKITPFTVPDETLHFVAELSSDQMKNNFLQSLYSSSVTPDFHTFSPFEKQNADILPEFFKNYADVITQQTHETYTETRIINGVVTQIPVTQTKVTTKTLTQQAQAAADFIEKIRNDRYAILTFAHETTLTKDAFEYLVNQLNEVEKQYLELFLGITTSEDIPHTLIIYPNSEYDLQPLFSVSPAEGFSTAMHKTPAYNYHLKFTPQASTEHQQNFYRKTAKNSTICF